MQVVYKKRGTTFIDQIMNKTNWTYGQLVFILFVFCIKLTVLFDQTVVC